MAIKHIVTGGFGNGTLSTTIPLVVMRGYVAAEAVAVDPASHNTWPTLDDGDGRTWTPDGDSRTVWNVVDKTRNL